MSVTSQIRQDWEIAKRAAVSNSMINTGNIEVANDGTNEYFVIDKSGDKIRISHPEGIICWVYSRGFRIRRVNESYQIKPIKSPRL